MPVRFRLVSLSLLAGILWSPGFGFDSAQKLPSPKLKGNLSVEEALHERRSVRTFSSKSLGIEQLAQLLWAAQGVTQGEGRRTSPSAGATYPLELYVATEKGLDHYIPSAHALERVSTEDLRRAIGKACLDQQHVSSAPALFILAADYSRTEARYSTRAERYVKMEAGHAAQNLLLQAVALRLAAVPVGAFRDGELAQVLSLPSQLRPLYVVPVGNPAR